MKPNPKKPRKRGFALIVTLSMMILLTIVAVGLLTLSTISLRTSAQGSAAAVARSNARLALMMAIGEVQKSLGPDQRISANAGSVIGSAQRPNVLGAWTALGWQAPTGGPVVSGDKAGKFRNWLVSTKLSTGASDFSLPGTAATGDSVWLSNPATTGVIAPNDTSLRADRIPITMNNANGGFAWIVTDNSTRASINLEAKPSVILANNVANRTAATSPKLGGLAEAFSKITEPTKLVSMQTAALVVGADGSKEITARTPALTPQSNGLLTNPVTGGLKTDLTPLLEGTSNLTTALVTASPYFPTTGSSAGSGAPTWDFLRSHYLLYRNLANLAGKTPRVRLSASDLRPVRTGIEPKPTKELLLPVIAKLQIVFSMVSHYSHLGDRIQALNTIGQPKGNTNHAVPHLVYDPVITLYNPYDVELELSQLRIRVSDPPVGFQFQKHDKQAGTHPWLRQEFATGQFQGLGQFQIAKEHDPNARKTFTMFLRNTTAANRPGGSVVLLPGEVKVFSLWVEPQWTWGLETAGGYTPRSFFDWNIDNNMGNVDLRTTNKKGVETIPGLDFRAGLQADHLSYGGGRPTDSKYSWENGVLGAGWVSMKLTDDITVNAKPQRFAGSSRVEPDFRVDILAGANDAADSDILRTYEFRMKDVATEMSTTSGSAKSISRLLNIGNILQTPADKTPGGKSPFAIFTMSAKTTRDPRDDSKSWAFNNMVTEGGSHDSNKVGNAAQSYDLRLQEVQDFTTFPGIEYDDAQKRGFFGAIANASGGVSIVPMYRVPLTPAASLGDWIASNLITSSQLPRVNYALGNSFAHPLIPSSQIQTSSPMQDGNQVLDHSYLMNAALWDSYFFSSAANYSSAAFESARSKADVLKDFFSATKPMLNSRLIPYFDGSGDAAKMAETFNAKSDLDFAKQFAGTAMIKGAFNVNSDSVDAWRAVLSSLRDAAVLGYSGQEYPVSKKTAFVRNGLPVAGSSDDANPANSVNALGQIRWAGYRTLTDDQIQKLATLIVEEIREQGKNDKAPSLSLGEFVNRHPGSASSLHALRGILQTAIEKSGVNDEFNKKDSNSINGSSLAQNRIVGLANPSALDGYTAEGAAPILTQGDLLTALAPIITVRGDTFTIRTYGEARAGNNTTVLARAWCEATIQRVPGYLDPKDQPEADPTTLTKVNQTFGRRFEIISFRWLSPSEI